jgi:hypothetical protein
MTYSLKTISALLIIIIISNFTCFGQGKERQPREPIIGAMVSVVPGCGQIYNEDYEKGLYFLSGALVISGIELFLLIFWPLALNWTVWIYLGIYFVLFVWSAFDAFFGSHLYNRRHGFFPFGEEENAAPDKPTPPPATK